MFESIIGTQITLQAFLICTAVSLILGLGVALLARVKNRTTKSFALCLALLPAVVEVVIMLVNGNIGAGLGVAGAFSLVRFRSAQGTSDEIAAILIAMASGIAFGMGFVGYGIVILICLSVLFALLAALPIFEHKSMAQDKLLRITIPESLDYYDVFDDTFAHYLASWESVGVKTTGMGSMFRLSFKIRMKTPGEEKAFIDELRTKNGNLEIAITPYADTVQQL